MRFSIEIELGNAEMQSFQDLRDALKQVATKLGSRQHCLGGAPSDGDGSKIMDGNGNSVGRWEISAERHTVTRSDGQSVTVVIPDRD